MESESELAQRQYYNEIAQRYDEHYAAPNALEYRYGIYDAIFASWDLEGKKVLDAMCGGGESTGYFVRRGAQVTGLDISEECCRIYQEKFPQCEVIRASALATGLPDEQFDFIMTDSLHHLHPHVNDGVIELTRLLRPGGHLFCWEPSAGSLFDAVRRLWYRLDKKYFEDNEAAIDARRLAATHADKLKELTTIYGGNLAYLFVSCSMALRIPVSVVRWYADTFIWLENKINKIQPRALSLWSMSLFEKR